MTCDCCFSFLVSASSYSVYLMEIALEKRIKFIFCVYIYLYAWFCPPSWRTSSLFSWLFGLLAHWQVSGSGKEANILVSPERRNFRRPYVNVKAKTEPQPHSAKSIKFSKFFPGGLPHETPKK